MAERPAGGAGVPAAGAIAFAPAGLAADAVAFAPAALAARFGHLLHAAGIGVEPDRAARFAAALLLLPPQRRESLYWTARVTLIRSPADLPVFDRVFAAVFDGRLDPADGRGDTSTEPVQRLPAPDRTAGPTVDGSAPGQASPRAGQAGAGEEGDTPAVLAAASLDERLRTADFADLSTGDLAALRGALAAVRWATPPRRSRRSRPARAGERIDLRRTLRRAQRSGGDPVRLVRRRRAQRPRRLVLLCDVSGSMERYTQVYLSVLHSAVTRGSAEAFVFATRLTRLTRPLRRRSVETALAEAAGAAQDWSGGTRLGESLRRFVDDYGHRRVARGAVVVVVSDGWSLDDPAEVAVQMARLGRLAHRIVWVNPRKAAPGFAPLVGGMAAALPCCDAFVSGHSLAALTEVASAVAAHSLPAPTHRRSP